MSNATKPWRSGLLYVVFVLSFIHSIQAQVTNTITFTGGAIVIPGDAATGNFYPANLVVSGQQAKVSKVVVTLTNMNLSTQYAAAAHLISPSGQAIHLFGRNGDGSSFLGNLVFDQASSNVLPTIYTAGFAPGTYQPAGPFGVNNSPAGITNNLNDLNGTTANGTWKLYFYLATTRDDFNATLPSWSLTITSLPAIANNSITAPATTAFCASGNAANIVGSTPTGGNNSYTYQWQSSTNNISFSNIATTTASYDPPSVSQTTYYRRIVNSSVLSDTSSAVTITVQPALGSNTLTAPATASFYTATGDAASITGSTPTGGSGVYDYQWQNSSNNVSFADISLATTKNYDPPSISSTTYYRRLVTSGACVTDNISSSVAISILYSSWTGAVSTAWETATNWSNGIPLTTYKANIPVAVRNPIVNSTTTIAELAMGNTSLTLNGDLLLTGNLTQAGGTIYGSSALGLTGATQTISGAGTINNLTVNSSGTATITGSVSISGTLTPTAGILASGGNLTLLKDGSSANGRIAAGSSAGGYLTGNVNVQTYIPGGSRKYRLLGHPFSTALNLANIASHIDITGSITGSNTNNFTVTSSSSPSAFSFSEALDDGLTGTNGNAGWQAYTSGNIASSIAAGQGIRILVRGSKGQAGSLTGGSYTPNPVTLTLSGPVKQGNFTQNLSFTDVSKGWNLVSNPYPSNIDWTTVTKTNVGAAVYTYRPSLSAGSYASYNNGSSTNGGSQYLEMGTSYFVRATAASPSLAWHEADKAATAPDYSVLRTFNNIHNRISLVLTNEQTNHTDEVVIRFGDDPATDLFDSEYDAYNLPGAAQDVYVMDTLKTKYSIYHGSALKTANMEKRAVALGMDNLLPGSYIITAKTLNAFVDGNIAYLKDAEMNVLTEITADISYPFSIAANQITSNRFSILFNAKEKLVQSGFMVTISPNPTDGFINIQYQGLNKKEATSIFITDMNGKLLKTVEVGMVETGLQSINTSRWAKGTYTVQLLNGSNKEAQTFIKQ
jgi:hypothetical protein